MRITGRNFGTVQPNWLENVAYGPHDAVLSLFGMYNASTAKVMRASGCSITIPHHVIECQTVAGVDADLLVVVRSLRKKYIFHLLRFGQSFVLS